MLGFLVIKTRNFPKHREEQFRKLESTVLALLLNDKVTLLEREVKLHMNAAMKAKS